MKKMNPKKGLSWSYLDGKWENYTHTLAVYFYKWHFYSLLWLYHVQCKISGKKCFKKLRNKKLCAYEKLNILYELKIAEKIFK